MERKSLNELRSKGFLYITMKSMIERGDLTSYVFGLEGVTFCHLCDLDHILNNEQVKEISKPNVLFLSIGGTFTINHNVVTKIASQLGSPMVIPMHYSIKGVDMPLLGVEPFLSGKRSVKRIDSNQLNLIPETIPKTHEFHILSLK